ncbi:MAG: sigma-70 family RNA polymerase sigma factor [Clostridiales bacterium]|nr:sigma-70 family RNA polymerase sigma factor [Candidatus Cacconaster stercorequi]
MSNEELAVLIRQGRDDLTPVLWEQVRGWAAKLALRWYHAFDGRCGVELDDLINTGYIAVVRAVQTFDPATGGFLTWLTFYIKTAFCEAYGVRRRVRDPLNGAASLDAPLSADDPGGATVGDMIPGSGEQDFIELEERLWSEQLHEALDNALHDLLPQQEAAIRDRYYHGKHQKDIAAEMGVTPQRVHELCRSGMNSIRKSPHSKKLRDFMPFNYYTHTGFSVWQQSGQSVEERYLLLEEKHREIMEQYAQIREKYHAD